MGYEAENEIQKGTEIKKNRCEESKKRKKYLRH